MAKYYCFVGKVSNNASQPYFPSDPLDFPNMLHYNSMNDTIYILENDEGIWDHAQYSTIFTRKDLLSYICLTPPHDKFRRNPICIRRKPFFHQDMLKLVVKWDLKKLRDEGEKGRTYTEGYIWLTRIIFSNEEYKIDCAIMKRSFDFDAKCNDQDHYEFISLDLPTVLKKIFE